MDIDLTENGWRTRVTYEGEIGYEALNQMLAVVMSFRSAVALDHFRFARDGINPLLYDYRIWLTDGRIWKQDITFDAGFEDDPLMTFTVQPAWRESEFVAHRELRREMSVLRNAYGASLVRIDPA